jgi:hypothetical protein
MATGFVLDVLKDATATTFDLIPLLNMAPNNQPTYLQFGDERFFYGNIQTFIGARIFKTIFDVRVNSSQFDTTTNPTRSRNAIKTNFIGRYSITNTYTGKDSSGR